MRLGIVLVAVSALMGCRAGVAQERPAFHDYWEAIDYARDQGCEVQPNSSWITRAEYCGNRFLILTMRGREYIFDCVPLSVWRRYRAAASKGTFYNSQLRDRYRLRLGDTGSLRCAA